MSSSLNAQAATSNNTAPTTTTTNQKNIPVEPPIKCRWDGCHDKYFNSEVECYRHLIAEHPIEGKQVCKWKAPGSDSICGYQCKYRGMLKDHSITHFSFAMRPFQCKHCNVFVRNRQDLRLHMIKYHQYQTQASSNGSGGLHCFPKNLVSSSDPPKNKWERTSSLGKGSTDLDSHSNRSGLVPVSQIEFCTVGISYRYFKRFVQMLRSEKFLSSELYLHTWNDPWNLEDLPDDEADERKISPKYIISFINAILYENDITEKIFMMQIVHKPSFQNYKLLCGSDLETLNTTLQNMTRCPQYHRNIKTELLKTFWRLIERDFNNEDRAVFLDYGYLPSAVSNNIPLLDSKADLNGYKCNAVAMLQITVVHQVERFALNIRLDSYLNFLNRFRADMKAIHNEVVRDLQFSCIKAHGPQLTVAMWHHSNLDISRKKIAMSFDRMQNQEPAGFAL